MQHKRSSFVAVRLRQQVIQTITAVIKSVAEPKPSPKRKQINII